MKKQINKTKKSSKKGTKTAAKSGSAKKTGRKAGTSKNAKSATLYEAKKTTVRKKRGKSSRIKQRNQRVFIAVLLIIIVLLAGWIVLNRAGENGWSIGDFLHNSDDMVSDTEQSETSSGDDSSGGPEQWQKEGAPYIDVELLTPNEYSRPQIPIESVNYIAIHYTANPGATAIANRNYFENLANTHDTKVSSHFVVGLDGEIVQCIPTWEVAYASNDRNYDTVSIECCHPDATGKFNDATYRSMVQLTAWLCLKFNLTEEDVIRHYDVTGKICPKYFVENEGAWDQFRKDVKSAMAMNKNPE